MKNNYLKFTLILSQIFSYNFGNIWWYSLLHEKNTSKSDIIHRLFKELPPKDYSFWQAIYNAIRKYIVYFGRYIIFKFKKKSKLEKNLFISYYGNFFNVLYDLPDSSVIILPQKTDWKRVWYDKKVLVLDSFISIKDFWHVLIDYFKIVYKFIIYYKALKLCIKELGRIYFKREDTWDLFREEVLKSFIGEVLIESLFFEKNFTRLFLQNQVEKVIYVYEGLAWEKVLCNIFKGKKIALLCTIPSDNMTNFWYDKKEVELMPKFDKLGVIGNDTYYRFTKIYGDKVFLLGSTRHQYLKDIKPILVRGDKNLVILGYNDKQSEALLEYLDNLNINYIVKSHPSSSLNGDNFIYSDLIDCLKDAKVVYMSSDSMASFDAYVFGVLVKLIELPEFANLNPLPVDVINIIEKEYFFEFRSNEDMIKLIKEL